MTSLLGTELQDEVFEYDGEGASEDVAPPEQRSAPELDAEIITTDFNPVQSFEVFLGRRYDPAEVADDDSCLVTSQPIVRPTHNAAEVLAVAAAIERGMALRASVGGGGPATSSANASHSMLSLETPLQRYQRLQSEVSALQEDLRALAAHDERLRPSKATPIDPSLGVWQTITSGLVGLSDSLDVVRPAVFSLRPLEPAAGGGVLPANAAQPDGADSNLVAVVASLQRLEADLAGITAGPPPPPPPALLPRPPSSAPAAAAVLESRVAALETAVLVSSGAQLVSDDDGAAAAAGPAAALARLQRRVDALATPGALGSLAAGAESALRALQAFNRTVSAGGGGAGEAASLDAVGSDAAAAAASGYTVVADARLRAAVSALERWDASALSLPQLSRRLLTLRDAHDQLAALPRQLAGLEAAVQAIDADIAADAAVLRELRGSILDVARTVQANLQLLPAAR